MTLQLLTCLSHSEPTRSDVHVSPPSYLSLACNGEAFTSQKGILAADPAPNNSFKGRSCRCSSPYLWHFATTCP